MNVMIEMYEALPCSTKVFKINGKDAYAEDFGYSEDIGKVRYDMPWACGNRIFNSYRDSPIEGLLEEYGITLKEYNAICDMLESKLYVGECHLCV